MHNSPHVKPGDRDVPKTGPLHHRLKNASMDQIPISKAPRRQKSSRFYVTEKVVLEPTPAFHGKVMMMMMGRGKYINIMYVNELFMYICRGAKSYASRFIYSKN